MQLSEKKGEDIAFQEVNGDRLLNVAANSHNHTVARLQRTAEALSLTVLDLTDNGLKEVPDDVGDLVTLRVLILKGNRVATLPNSLSKLSNLEELDVSGNRLSTLNPSICRSPHLKLINASDNRITKLDDVGVELAVVDLSHNRISSWPLGLLACPALVEVDLSYNRITRIPDNLNDMRSLAHLRLRANIIDQLPPLNRMHRLECLELGGNRILSGPDVTGCLNLKELRLDGNRIREMDMSLLAGTSLSLLSLSGNRMERMSPPPPSLRDTLTHLDLSDNRLTKLPHQLARLDKVVVLRVKGNKFIDSDVERWATIGADHLLRHLSATGGEQQSAGWDEGPRYLSGLEVWRSAQLVAGAGGRLPAWLFRKAESEEVMSVDMSGGQVGRLPAHLWRLAPFLERLCAQGNRLSRVPASLCHFHKLTALDLSRNRLTGLPRELAHLTHLTHLNIHGNRFNQLPLVVYRMRCLKYLSAGENRIKEIDLEALKHLKHLSMRISLLNTLTFQQINLDN